MDNRYFELFNAQQKHQYSVGNTSYNQRIEKLNALQRAIQYTYKQAIRDAMYADFKKPEIETDLTEIYLVVREIKHAKANLRHWLKRQKVPTPLALLGTSSYYKYEPKGVCLIISPWNYPLNLTFSPLVSAIAAGNTVIIKPSELTPNTSKVMATIINDLFDEYEIALIEGDVETSQELLKLPFNHIFFTGSSAVGKIVMAAASKHLTSVTLELGGKSPTIIDETANIKKAIDSLVWGKHLNNGQTCIAPDYVLIHNSKKDEFMKAYKEKVIYYYSKDASASASYSRIVNDRHFNRLTDYIEDAKQHGAKIELGGNYDATDNFIEPTVISYLNEDTKLANEEVFGPILPLKTFDEIDEVIQYINSKEKPLALYIYSQNQKTIDKIINTTRAGGTCINTNALQGSNHDLPFGGSNGSGIGKTHGFFGFQDFSNHRAVLKRHTFGPLNLLLPPYTKFKQKLADLTIKWF
ncbi:aldehyde dehydrogenase (NAD+) [Flavobacteriaceae bacterium MAR_2010_72]|nr:aldehyde dehydrogenase (NAD+) [Flavobacteriaceae bacterium MAR_2010_72]TVZ58561.1 aldehyde dehydrogenase (NAD+) [Flavobacteriaceae bacterium MAR_2010_105]